jgi:hypothetical protein
MSKKNRNKSVEIYLMAVVTCIVLTGLWIFLATHQKALAAPPDGKGKGGDKVTTIFFDVLLGDNFTGLDSNGNPSFSPGDIFMVCGSGIEGRIESGAGGTNIDRMIVNSPSPQIDITSVIEDVVAVGENPQDADCFGGLWNDETNGYIGLRGGLLTNLPDRTLNVMTVAYIFRAEDTNGKNVAYTIQTTGVLLDLDEESDGWGDELAWAAAQDAVNDGTADPANVPNFFVQIDAGTPWTLSKTDGSQKFACTGDGTFESGFGICITDPRLDRRNSTLVCP